MTHREIVTADQIQVDDIIDPDNSGNLGIVTDVETNKSIRFIPGSDIWLRWNYHNDFNNKCGRIYKPDESISRWS